MNILGKIFSSTKKSKLKAVDRFAVKSVGTRAGRILHSVMMLLSLVFLLVLFLELVLGRNIYLQVAELVLGVIFLVELLYRFFSAEKKRRKALIKSLHVWIDMVVIFSIFGHYIIEDGLILQMLSAFRIFQVFRALYILSQRYQSIYYYYETLKSVTRLLSFIVITSTIVFNILGPKNEGINSGIDAVYFTITTLTTTGYGDILVQDDIDKILVIFIMIFGVTLFLQLVSQLFKPRKVFYHCESCGLMHHERDATHCKSCGKIIHIEVSD